MSTANDIAAAFAAVTSTPEAAAGTPTPSPNATTPPAPAAPAAAPTPEPAQQQQFTPEYVQRLRQEAAEYRVAAAALDGLHPEDRAAVLELATALRQGDMEGIDSWIAGAFEARGLAQQYAAQMGQQAPTAAQQQAQANVQQQVAQSPVPLTPEQVRQMFREELATVEQEWRVEQERMNSQAAIEAEFVKLGIQPGSEVATAVARVGQRMCIEQQRFVPPAEAYEAWKQMVAPIFGQQPAAQPAQPGVPVPPVPPSGVPVAAERPTDPSERVRARFDAMRRGIG